MNQAIHFRNLVTAKLSYNHIEDLSGFQALRGSDFKLEHLELQGNKLKSVGHVGICLQVCANTVVSALLCMHVHSALNTWAKLHCKCYNIAMMDANDIILKGCANLRHLELKQGGATNPLCQQPGNTSAAEVIIVSESSNTHTALVNPD